MRIYMYHRPSVIITGASRGIGAALAMKFAREGYDLSLSCLKNIDRLEQIRQKAEQSGVDCLTWQGDMGDPLQADAFIRASVERFGCPPLLINNAGISYIGLLQDMEIAEWNRILQTNLTSVFACCKAIIPQYLQKHAGAILNISSVWGSQGASTEAAYSATKGGINALTRALAKELAPSNIPVNAIACGFIDTEMNRFLDEEERQMLMDEIPMGRAGTPEEVAELAWQIFNSPSYLTGQVITLDGGWI